MAKKKTTDRLDIVDGSRGLWQIKWFLVDDDNDFGAILGEVEYTFEEVAQAEPDDWEHRMATYVAGKSKGVERCSGGLGYGWESLKDAKAALTQIRAALKGGMKEAPKKPWPQWALEAKAAGWKAPKGWTP
jgi:hypothetical protein